ncbi:hypothetical protein [Micromonospora sp. MW-13]|uniref:hypothetical protein n=1 Tax=Micromonospora sp. MW-13 TaxID=2094022 RepID=UPI000FFEE9BE|nr:hypothetical protein [Micromonospora sp. MW-13]
MRPFVGLGVAGSGGDGRRAADPGRSAWHALSARFAEGYLSLVGNFHTGWGWRKTSGQIRTDRPRESFRRDPSHPPDRDRTDTDGRGSPPGRLISIGP